MGKPIEHHAGIGEAAATHGLRLLCPCTVSLRCVLVLILSVCVFLSAVFWLPPFRSWHGFHPSNQDLSADIQATFILAKPFSQLVPNVKKLEYDIFEEIGVPDSKVSVISMHPSALTNSTRIVFGVLADSKYASISSPALSLLKSSLVELALHQVNLSFSPELFGHSSSFEVLKFPGGITITPGQSASLWKMPQILFNFSLNNSISHISKNFDELKNQLKFGLQLRYYENVYLELTNMNGSTLSTPVTVQASVLSDIGSHIPFPDRLKELAKIILGPHAKNLGLSHSVFGKVKSVQLSSYLKHSISIESPSPSPSLSPSPSPSPTPSPSSTPTLSPSEARASVPSCPFYPTPSPSLTGHRFSPSESPLPYTGTPELGPAFDNSPSPSFPPKPGTLGSTPKMSPSFSPYPSPARRGLVWGTWKASIAPTPASLEISQSLSSHLAQAYAWHMILLGSTVFHLMCGLW